MADADAIVVGSGINGLACGALLAKAGWKVCVLERNDWFGGAIKTAEITEPGFQHDVFSAWHPLWVGGAAHAQLGDDLARHGLEYLNTELPTATRVPRRRERVPATHHRRERRRARPPPRWRRRRLARDAGGVLPERRPRASACSAPSSGRATASALGVKDGAPASGATGPRRSRARCSISARDWLETTFGSERAHGLLAPWVLHTGLGPDAAASGYMAQVIAVAVQEGGMPIPRGGGARLADALVALIREQGGDVRDRRARRAACSRAGVRTSTGDEAERMRRP